MQIQFKMLEYKSYVFLFFYKYITSQKQVKQKQLLFYFLKSTNSPIISNYYTLLLQYYHYPMKNTSDNYSDSDHNDQTKEEPKKKRRLKKQKDETDFICECGKKYQSSAALYTHKKNKHENDEITYKIQSSDKKRRNNIISNDENRSIRVNEKVNINKYQLDLSLQQFILFVKQFPYKQNKIEISEYFQSLKYNAELYQQIKNWKSNQIYQKINPQGLIHVTYDQAFSKFLYKIAALKMDKTIYGQIIIIFCTWRDFLNDRKKNNEEIRQQITKNEPPLQILDSINQFIQKYFPENYLKYIGIINEPLLLCPKKKQFNLCRFLLIFANWLYAQKYIIYKIKYNDE